MNKSHFFGFAHATTVAAFNEISTECKKIEDVMIRRIKMARGSFRNKIVFAYVIEVVSDAIT